MNAFLRSIEKTRLDEHERLILSMRGIEAPDERERWGQSTDMADARRVAAGMKAKALTERVKAVRRLRESGLIVRDICKQLGITQRQLYWAEKNYP